MGSRGQKSAVEDGEVLVPALRVFLGGEYLDSPAAITAAAHDVRVPLSTVDRRLVHEVGGEVHRSGIPSGLPELAIGVVALGHRLDGHNVRQARQALYHKLLARVGYLLELRDAARKLRFSRRQRIPGRPVISPRVHELRSLVYLSGGLGHLKRGLAGGLSLPDALACKFEQRLIERPVPRGDQRLKRFDRLIQLRVPRVQSFDRRGEGLLRLLTRHLISRMPIHARSHADRHDDECGDGSDDRSLPAVFQNAPPVSHLIKRLQL